MSDSRGKILNTAVRLFGERGYAKTSTREVVEGAGVTKPTLYYYFANKEALWREAVTSEAARLTDRVRTACKTESNCVDRLWEVASTFLKSQDGEGARLLRSAWSNAEGGQPAIPLSAWGAEQIDLLTELLRDGVKSGEFRPDLPVSSLAKSLVFAFHVRLFQQIEQASSDDDEATLFDILLHGVASR